MSIIRQKFTFEGSRGKRGMDALVDSAASECLIRPEVARRLGCPDETAEPMSFDTSKQKDGLKSREWVGLAVRLNGQRHYGMFFLVDELTEDIVIGARFLQAHECQIDYKRKKLRIGKCCVRLRA